MILDILGVDDKSKEFILEHYLPLLDEKIGHIELTLLEKAELFENPFGTVIKLLYGFVWQENIDLGGKIIYQDDLVLAHVFIILKD